MFVETIIALTCVVGQETVYALDNCSYATNVTGTHPAYGTDEGEVRLTCEQQTAAQTKKAVVNARYYWPAGPDGKPLLQYIFQDYSEGCSFPFIYRGVNYTRCATVDTGGRPWCATETDINNNFIGQYKFCEAVDRYDMQEGLDHWMEHTCIKMEETNNTDQPHVQFIVGGGCYSYMGRIAQWNGQPLSIGAGCSFLQIIVHEIGHAVGLMHEQERLDRDDFVAVLWDNIGSGKESNFAKDYSNNFDVTYDYSSVMHYTDSGFSINGNPTLISKDPMAQEVIGVRNLLTGLSHRDKLLVNRMYKCIDVWLLDCGLLTEHCLNDGYTGKDCRCVCPPGTNGYLCQNIIDDYYGHLQSSLNERISTETTISVQIPTDTSVFAKVITPPVCHRAILTFTYSNMPFDCSYQRLYVRANSLDYYGQRLCGDEIYPGLNFTSETEIIITMYNYYSSNEKKTIWEAEVEFENIPGCSTTTTTPGPTCPPPPTCPNCPTIPPPGRIRHCVSGGNYQLSLLPRGKTITITSPLYPKPYPRNRISCGWKLQAEDGGTLSIKCDHFKLNEKDKLRLHVPKVQLFSYRNALSSRPNIMIIKFASRRGNRGPGFKCTVASK